MSPSEREIASRIERRRQQGASLVEYALLIALIAMVCFAAVGFLGEATESDVEANTSSLFQS